MQSAWVKNTHIVCVFMSLIMLTLQYAYPVWHILHCPGLCQKSWKVCKGGVWESPTQTVHTMRLCSCLVFPHYMTAAWNSAGFSSKPYCPCHTNFIIYCHHRGRTGRYDLMQKVVWLCYLPAQTQALYTIKLSFLMNWNTGSKPTTTTDTIFGLHIMLFLIYTVFNLAVILFPIQLCI